MKPPVPTRELVDFWTRRLRLNGAEAVRTGVWAVLQRKKDRVEEVRCYVGPPCPEAILASNGPDPRPILIVQTSGVLYKVPLDYCNEFSFRAAAITTSAFWAEDPRLEKTELWDWLTELHGQVCQYLIDNRGVGMQKELVLFGHHARDTYGECEDAQLNHAYESIRHAIRRHAHRISEDDLVRLYREFVVQEVLED